MKMTVQILIVALGFSATQVDAQQRRMDQDPSRNNLVHPPGYKTVALGTLGRVTKVGTGSQDMILIAGGGFGGDIYDRFMASRTDQFTMYAVTLAGFGGTPAPPMPPVGTSYGDQTWTKAAQKGVEQLIKDKGLKNPVIVAHWIFAPHVALGVALSQPENVGAIVLISGRSKTMQVGPRRGPELKTPEQRAYFIDNILAPRWFKTVTRDTWDDNNFYPHDYARHPVRALQLWRMAYAPTLPVWVRYLCEAWTYDASFKVPDLKVPTLIVIPGFDEGFYFDPAIDYMRAFCQKSWNGIEKLSDQITVKRIEDARVFIMDDQPEELDATVNSFLQGL